VATKEPKFSELLAKKIVATVIHHSNASLWFREDAEKAVVRLIEENLRSLKLKRG
jgi:hypothetical protein